MSSLVNSTKQLRANTYPTKTIPKIAEEKTLLNSFSEASITLIQNQRYHTHTHKENYSPISFMNIDAKIQNKTVVNLVQQ